MESTPWVEWTPGGDAPVFEPGAAATSGRRRNRPRVVELTPEAGGDFSGTVDTATAGTLYRYRLDGGPGRPDPASRFQPDGPHGPSCVIDPAAFAWTDWEWPGVRLGGQVIYELHVGTFTRAGTWTAAGGELDHLAAIGISLIEVMPVADFAGRFGWGDDWLLLVNLGPDVEFAPAPEPLLAPPPGRWWAIRWTSEDPADGGGGQPAVETESGRRLIGQAAVVLAAEPDG